MAVQSVLNRIDYDASVLCGRVRRSSIADEDDFTSRLAQEIETSLDGQSIDRLRFRVETRRLRWRGPGAEESEFGADLIVVVTLSTRLARYSKGYLIQAKLERPTTNVPLASLSRDQRKLLDRQCNRMLNVTGESYVWVYRPDKIAVLRALTIAGSDPAVVSELKRRSFRSFWSNALQSWSGDPHLSGVNTQDLERAVERSRARRLLYSASLSTEY
jgi:hypothetical protein